MTDKNKWDFVIETIEYLKLDDTYKEAAIRVRDALIACGEDGDSESWHTCKDEYHPEDMDKGELFSEVINNVSYCKPCISCEKVCVDCPLPHILGYGDFCVPELSILEELRND